MVMARTVSETLSSIDRVVAVVTVALDVTPDSRLGCQ